MARNHIDDVINPSRQPKPISNEHPYIKDLVIDDIKKLNNTDEYIHGVIADINAKAEIGRSKYGTYLQPFNGRNAIVDLYQELIDAAKYARLALFEDPANNDLRAVYTKLLHQMISIKVMINV